MLDKLNNDLIEINAQVMKIEEEINYLDSVLVTNMSPLNDLINERSELVEKLRLLRNESSNTIKQIQELK